MLGALNCPFGTGHTGVADEHQITREYMDDFALTSQIRPAAAIDAGHFQSQIGTGAGETRPGGFCRRRTS